jgi:hypothetical protein
MENSLFHPIRDVNAQEMCGVDAGNAGTRCMVGRSARQRTTTRPWGRVITRAGKPQARESDSGKSGSGVAVDAPLGHIQSQRVLKEADT